MYELNKNKTQFKRKMMNPKRKTERKMRMDKISQIKLSNENMGMLMNLTLLYS